MTMSSYLRHGRTRFDPTINWRDVYAERLATPEMAAAMFNSGDHLWIPAGTRLAADPPSARGSQRRT